PTYEITPAKREVIRELKDALKSADELYLATDEDREGEAISWHLIEVLKPRVPVKRMVSHETTRPAIEEAVRNWRALDAGLVDAGRQRVANGTGCDDSGAVRGDGVLVLAETAARRLVDGLRPATFRVASVEERPYTSKPKPPFMTSTMQQEGGRKLRMGAQQ